MSQRKAARRRRTAEEARREILEAAQKRLAAGGPEAVRLQDIAADVGISHPAILHHFESREGLLQALAARTLSDLNEELIRAIEHGQTEPGYVLDRVFETLSDAGHARLLAWRSLSGRSGEGADPRRLFKELIDAVHRRVQEEAVRCGVAAPTYEESAFCMRLASLAMFGDAIIGRDLNESSGLDEDSRRRFRQWLDRLLTERLTPGLTDEDTPES
jgi:AcrR family transcriptional regulator